MGGWGITKHEVCSLIGLQSKGVQVSGIGPKHDGLVVKDCSF